MFEAASELEDGDDAAHDRRAQPPHALLCAFARAVLARTIADDARADAPDAGLMRLWLNEDPGLTWLGSCLAARTQPSHPVDSGLVRLARALSLSPAETIATAIAIEVERDPRVGRVLAYLQDPLGASRPTLGLLAAALGASGIECDVDELATGPAVRTRLWQLLDDGAPLPERSLALPAHLVHALRGRSGRVGGVTEGLRERERIPLARSLLAAAARYAEGVRAGGTLVVRSGDPSESRAVAAAIVDSLELSPLFIDGDAPPGLVPWLHLERRVPVFVRRPGPGERIALPELEGWRGPVVVASGPEGSVEGSDGTALSFRVPVPPPEERAELWTNALGDALLAGELARNHRHPSGRIAELGRLAHQLAAMDARRAPTRDDVHAASFHGDSGLGTLAQPIAERVSDDALVLTPGLRRELELLLARCRTREDLTLGLGSAAITRYRTGVRALFVGASGTGKTLAVSWLACRLALPLYRVDMAAVVSKYIGETERNLSDLLARAESAEVVLFFDEADALFGKRTEVRQSNDRFANAQTNYLLQRIESYDGIVVLASNSRSRFDAAFSRRLDQVLEFPLPGPEERRALWSAHLGTGHTLAPRDLNELAASCDLAGGHVRNAVLAAAVLAREAARPIAWNDVLLGLALECRKLGKPLPPNLSRRS